MFDRKRELPLNPFTPWRTPAESLQRLLVGRDHIVKDLLDKTERFCNGAPAKHCLLIGRRGLGKTHILTLLYHCLENNCTVREFKKISGQVLPVILLEEERYSLNTLVVFMITLFEKFCEKYPTITEWQIPAEIDDDDDIIEYCFEILKTIAKSENKKIIILCDNLGEVFNQWRDKEFKQLRAFLSDQQAVMIIGTAVRVFKEIVSPKQPFYEFFETTPLVELSEPQMVELLHKRFVEDNMRTEFKFNKKKIEQDVAALSKLTGGNPRMMVFIYDIITKKSNFEIEDAAIELMEALSEYFRSRFAHLAPQERTILDAFAGMDGPVTPKEIAAKTRIKEQSTYVHIKNLKDAGFIEAVEYGKHKISRYDVTERLFRIWRQTVTSHGRKKFQVFIKFLKLYFTTWEFATDSRSSYAASREKTRVPVDSRDASYVFERPGEDFDPEVVMLIDKACIGDFGEQMEGLAGKLAKLKMDVSKIQGVATYIYRFMEKYLLKNETKRAEGLYLTLLKLPEWHKIVVVQECIALFLKNVVQQKNQQLFIKTVSWAQDYISHQELKELIKVFVYAGKYLQENNKVIFEEVFPEERDILFDILTKLGSNA